MGTTDGAAATGPGCPPTGAGCSGQAGAAAAKEASTMAEASTSFSNSDIETASEVSSSWAGGAFGASGAPSAAEQALRKQNIYMMFIFQVLSAVAWGAAMGPVFDRYLYFLGGGAARGPVIVPRHARNSLVGMTESISGLSSLVLAVPVGLLVDRRPDKRAWLLRLSSVFGLAATAAVIAAVATDFLLLLYVALVLLGAFSQLSSSASEAIFADSIPQGQRSGLFTTKAILSTVGGAIGPLLSAAGLWKFGDDWEPYQMRAVVVAGTLLMPVSCVALFFFQDPQPEQREQRQQQEQQQGGAEEAPQGGAATLQQSAMPRRRFGPLRPGHVPFILALSDLMTCIGAGMTVKFFNLFFIEDQHFSGIQICALQTAYPLVIAVFMKFTERLSKPLGRSQASLLFFSSNVLCLFMLSQLNSLPLLLMVFLVRGGFANSTYPLDRSILMDFTPSEQRGRWNAVESLTSMTWSGSAFFGGLLSDKKDYRFTFLITAVVYATACVMYSPLLALVPRKEDDAATASTGDSGGAIEASAGGAAREVPLLS